MSTSDTLTLDVSTAVKAALSVAPPATADAVRWHSATVSTLADVERLLVRAEGDGFRENELTVVGPDIFVVRWR